MSQDFMNADAENALIAGILQYDYNTFLDVSDIVNAACIKDEVRSGIFECVEYCYKVESNRKLDIHSITSASHSLGIEHLIDTPESLKLIRSFSNYPIEEKTVLIEARKVRVRYEAGQYFSTLKKVALNLKNTTGEEDISSIIEMVEKPVFDLTSKINDTDKSKGTLQIAEGIDEILDDLETNPGVSVGIPTPFPKYNWCIGGGFTRGDVSIIAARMKAGKAQPLDAQVMTPSGPRLMGDLQVGDLVCTPDWKTSPIRQIHHQGVTDIYRVVFNDGDSTECTQDHLWQVKRLNVQSEEVLPLKDIIGEYKRNKQHVWSVMLPELCHYESKDVPVNTHKDFIPDIYKYNSQKVRLGVLRNFLEADDSTDQIEKDGIILIRSSTTYHQLAKDIKEIVQSLGGMCQIFPVKEFDSFNLWIRFNRGRKSALCRKIENVEYVGKKEAQCITLEDESGLYMTNDCIVTHNSHFLDEIALHVAEKLNIPVLNVDTEMNRLKHIQRMLGNLSGVNTRDIRNGMYVHDKEKRELVRAASERMKKMPYYYECVKGKTFAEHISAMRRWVTKSVGTDSTGRTNDGLILYDYLQPPNHGEYSGNNREDQIIGYQMLSLIELAGKCDIPILSAYQLNRTGIEKDDASTLSNSDRVAQKANNVTLLKRKTMTEIAEMGKEFGTSKLIPIETRDGEPLDEGDYINLIFDGRTSSMREGLTRNEVVKLQKDGKVEPLKTELDDDETIDLRESGSSDRHGDGKSGTDIRGDGDKGKKPGKKAVRKVPDPPWQ